jgi:integrase
MDYISKHPDMMNLAVGILFRTGLRVGELVALQKDDCKGNQLFVHATETRIKDKHGSYHYEVKPTPKTDAGIRTVILPDNARWMLEQLLSMNPSGKYLFERPSGKRLHAYHIRGRLYYICDQCDIPRRSPHKIRKTYATILLDNHVDTTLITSQMGHTDILTTEHFYHRDRRDMDAKAAIINALPDFQ